MKEEAKIQRDNEKDFSRTGKKKKKKTNPQNQEASEIPRKIIRS